MTASISVAKMLKEQILETPLSGGANAIIDVLRSYPFTMKNQNGYPFKPDDVIHFLENNIDSAGNLKSDISNHAMIDNTYGLNQQLSTLAQMQGLTLNTTSQRTEKPRTLSEGMLFSKREWEEKSRNTEKSTVVSKTPQKHAKLTK